MSTIDQNRRPADIFDALTLKTCHIREALDIACQQIPEEYVRVASLLHLLQGSLEEVDRIAEELFQRVPS